MNVLVLGCSWTSGTSIAPNINSGYGNTGEANWVYQLSKIMPEHNFYNFAFPGTSVLHSINIMEQTKKLKNFNFDKIIFQITNEGRFTYYKDLESNFVTTERIIQKEKNYYFLDLDFNQVLTVNYGTLNHPESIKEYKFAKMLYENFTVEHNFSVEQKVYVEWLKNNTSLIFFHKKDFCLKDESILTIENLLSKDTWNSFIFDGPGCHFNIEGCKWQANYISQYIKY